jgi:hypothetical protein
MSPATMFLVEFHSKCGECDGLGKCIVVRGGVKRLERLWRELQVWGWELYAWGRGDVMKVTWNENKNE